MTVKIPFLISATQRHTLCPEVVYNPVLLNFYRYLGGDFIPNTPVLANELAKWGGKYGDGREYILFEQDEDATIFLLRFT